MTSTKCVFLAYTPNKLWLRKFPCGGTKFLSLHRPIYHFSFLASILSKTTWSQSRERKRNARKRPVNVMWQLMASQRRGQDFFMRPSLLLCNTFYHKKDRTFCATYFAYSLWPLKLLFFPVCTAVNKYFDAQQLVGNLRRIRHRGKIESFSSHLIMVDRIMWSPLIDSFQVGSFLISRIQKKIKSFTKQRNLASIVYPVVVDAK